MIIESKIFCFIKKEANIRNCILLSVVLLVGGFYHITYANPAKMLVASWYSIKSLKKDGQYRLTKGVMANGKLFRDGNLTCACNLVSLGGTLRITNKNNGKTVMVTVTDHINRRFSDTRIDLSKGAFSKISPLGRGLAQVRVEVVK